MDEIRITNSVELRGTLASRPVFSHESRGERFFHFSLEVSRLSGVTDSINIVAREQLLAETLVELEDKLLVVGELRSFNDKSGERSKLVITVFAKELTLDSAEDVNIVELSGALCKQPTLRTTPMGREICDLMIAVNRRYGRSDYLPCISWGQRAREASGWQVGAKVRLLGRIQSRCYIKNIDGVPVEKTAYEVSIIEIDECVEE